ncbi:MAG: sterol desaturase family protein [Hyphomonadaceae bacterium]
MAMIENLGETGLRVLVFMFVFSVMSVFEFALPRRKRALTRVRRWSTNLAIFGLATGLVRLLAFLAWPVAGAAAAIAAYEMGWGLFNWLDWPVWIELVLTIVLLDFFIWFQHLASHHIQILWRLHRVHHADRDFDLTTALRFHPIEIALSAAYKFGLIFLLGPTAIAVITFEIILNGSAMFNHANARLPLWLDKILRQIIVTPDMHRVHHSVYKDEHDTNFGFFLSIWDRLFQTYSAQPRDGHDSMEIGLEKWRTDDPSKFTWSLLLPFR